MAWGRGAVTMRGGWNRFWAGGRRRALVALREELRSKLEALADRLRATEDAQERARLRAEIAQARAELAGLEQALRWALF
jgi:hypothetical protein